MNQIRINAVLICCALSPVCLSSIGQNTRKDLADEQIRIPEAKQNLPAEQVFKNIEILSGKPARRLPEMMNALNRQLGVECTSCHVAGAWESEQLETKRTSRRMFQMVASVSKAYLESNQQISCWTCHRGNAKPDDGHLEIAKRLSSLAPQRRQMMAALDFGSDNFKPAGEVFQNVQILKSMPTQEMVRLMEIFTMALGVDCSACHVSDQYDDDVKPEKETARRMLQMVQDINQQISGGQPKVGCWTCHHGSKKPEIAPGS